MQVLWVNVMTYLVTYVLCSVDIFYDLWLFLFSGKTSSCRRFSLVRKYNRSCLSEWGGKCSTFVILVPYMLLTLYVLAERYHGAVIFFCILARVYSRSNSTKSPASGAHLSESRFISQVGTVREVMCEYISVFLQTERWRCQYWSAYVVAVVTWLRWEGRKVSETPAEGCHAEW